jgi:hypothetical protein
LNQDQITSENELSSERPSRNPQASKSHDAGSSDELRDPVRESIVEKAELPLFLRDSAEGPQGDAQDEKDESEE